MNPLLDWSYASKADRRDRQAFTCARPPKRTYAGGRLRTHPRPWEMDVQDFLRDHTVQTNEVMRVGRDSQGIAAMSAWWEIEPGQVLLQALAVDCRHRGTGGAHARELLNETLRVVEARAQAVEATTFVDITARVDERNLPSQRLCQWAEMTRLNPLAGDPYLWEWGYRRVF